MFKYVKLIKHNWIKRYWLDILSSILVTSVVFIYDSVISPVSNYIGAVALVIFGLLLVLLELFPLHKTNQFVSQHSKLVHSKEFTDVLDNSSFISKVYDNVATILLSLILLIASSILVLLTNNIISYAFLYVAYVASMFIVLIGTNSFCMLKHIKEIYKNLNN